MTDDAFRERALTCAALYGVLPRDANERAIAIGVARAPLAAAPSPATAAELRALASAAGDAGMALVEPELLFLQVSAKSAVDRAVIATFAFGPRPLVFVPAARAPKNGLVKIKDERVLACRVARAGPPPRDASPLFQAALDVLEGPTPAKELLRATRARLGAASADDGPALARALVGAWTLGTIALFASEA